MKHFIILSLMAIIALLIPVPGTFFVYCIGFVPAYLVLLLVVKAIMPAKENS